MSPALVTQSRRHSFASRGLDLYETDPRITRALLKYERLPLYIWEPACGRGAIVNVLRAAGHQVVATDIADYGVPVTAPGYLGIDFLKEHMAPAGTEAIVTNPPYRLAAEFVRHALRLCPRVVMLLRLAFLESVSWSDILDDGGLARVYPFRNRAPMMHRDGRDGQKTNSAVAFAWFSWDAAHNGPPTIHRISWERE
jgi:hypothetical protein